MPDHGMPGSLMLAQMPFPFAIFQAARGFFADTPPVNLIFLAVVLQITGQVGAAFSTTFQGEEWARRLGYASFLFYSLHEYAMSNPENGEAVSHFLAIGFRAFLSLLIVQGAASTVLPVVARIRSQFQQSVRSLRQALARPLPIQVPAPQPTTPAVASVDQAEALRTALAWAKKDYEVVCEALRSAGLDEEELEVALLFERQRYVRNIRGLRKS